MKNISFYDICMYIYSHKGECEDEDRKNIYTLKAEVNKSLCKLNNLLQDKYGYGETELIMSLVIDYAEVYAKQYFIHGVEQGVMLCKELNKVENTF